MKNILITSSLTNDMIRPIGPKDTLPHKLHIGYQETLRLLGPDWKNGPLLDFLRYSQDTDPNNLSIVHVRDYHAFGESEVQDRELKKYGPHCMAGSEGAKFIWTGHDVLEGGRNKPYVYDSQRIMAATEPGFRDIFMAIVGDTPKDEVKIGIIGLLTNIKVKDKAIALQGYYGFPNITVCSALCASNNRRKHFEALDDLVNIYGIGVTDSISLFSDWLSVRSKPYVVNTDFDVPRIEVPSSIKDNHRKVAEYLFRDCADIRLKDLAGGFSGSKVYLVQSTDKSGIGQVPNVLKVDDHREMIAKERAGFEKVQYVLGPHVPRIEDSVETDFGAGIRYSFAMMNKTDMPRPFKEFFTALDVRPLAGIGHLLSSLSLLYDEILKPMASSASINPTQIWEANSFCTRYAEHTLQNIALILGHDPGKDPTIRIAGIDFFNPAHFYSEQNIDAKLHLPPAYVKRGLAHGDLNLSNILIDSKTNLWILDFYHTGYDWHAIQDIVKMENDLKFIHTPLHSEDDLRQAIAYEKLLMSQSHLGQPLPNLPDDLIANPSILRLDAAIRKLRNFAYKISGDGDMSHYRIPQLRYSAHNLSFDESTDLQKMLALASTALLCESLYQ